MYKGFLGSLVLVLALGLIFGFCCSFCFAEESLTITTYYPSPYGSYNQLEVHRSVTYKPFTSLTDIQALSSPGEGELVYNGGDDKFYYYNGSAWAAQGGGGGGCYTNYGSLDCAAGYDRVLAGYMTMYTWIASGGGQAIGSAPVCSSVTHSANTQPEAGGTYASSDAVNYSPVNNEPCAICCK